MAARVPYDEAVHKLTRIAKAHARNLCLDCA